MKIQNWHFSLLAFVLVVSVAGYVWVINQPFFQNFISWAQQNVATYFLVLVSLKTLAIVWPPIPGGLLTLGSIPVIGWFKAYLAQVMGGLLGAAIAYYLGKKYGYRLLRKLFDDHVIAKIQMVKIIKRKELEAIFVLRLFTGAISEAISYGAGLLNIRFNRFTLGTLLAFLFEMPIFYLTNTLFVSGRNYIFNAVIVLIGGILFFKLKGKYFE